jgi:wyosine [tRNA(Phe)-imidazoG37] synthetase (radical SAM superfamily)
VPSRRLGRSLGIDLLPYKTCSYDCVYCQVGRTTTHTSERTGIVAPAEIIGEVRRRLESGVRPDYITISGSGEPTLYAALGGLIRDLKQFGVPVAVLTNGSLLWRPEVAESLSEADLVCPTLDAATPDVWRRVNRPAAGLDFGRMIEGLISFRGNFTGQLWLEVLLVAGLNDSEAEVRAIAELSRRIRPERVQLNTVVRPPADRDARPVPPERLALLAALFKPPAEVIAETARLDSAVPAASTPSVADGGDEILDLLRRHPGTDEDVAAGLGLPIEQARASLAGLLAAGRIRMTTQGGRTYYEVTQTRDS